MIKVRDQDKFVAIPCKNVEAVVRPLKNPRDRACVILRTSTGKTAGLVDRSEIYLYFDTEEIAIETCNIIVDVMEDY